MEWYVNFLNKDVMQKQTNKQTSFDQQNITKLNSVIH